MTMRMTMMMTSMIMTTSTYTYTHTPLTNTQGAPHSNVYESCHWNKVRRLRVGGQESVSVAWFLTLLWARTLIWLATPGFPSSLTDSPSFFFLLSFSLWRWYYTLITNNSLACIPHPHTHIHTPSSYPSRTLWGEHNLSGFCTHTHTRVFISLYSHLF